MPPPYVAPTSLPDVIRGTTPLIGVRVMTAKLPALPGAQPKPAIDTGGTVTLSCKEAPGEDEPVAFTITLPMIGPGVAERNLTLSETDRSGTFYVKATLVYSSGPRDGEVLSLGSFKWVFLEG